MPLSAVQAIPLEPEGLESHEDFKKGAGCDLIYILLWRADWRWFVFKIREPVTKSWPPKSLPSRTATCRLCSELRYPTRGESGAEILSVIQAMIHSQSHFWGWGTLNRRKQSCRNLQKGAHGLVAVLVAIFWVKQDEVLNEGSSNGIREKGTSSHLSCEFEVLVWKPRELYDTSREIYVSRN